MPFFWEFPPMRRYLFIHPNFPGQFLHLANHLIRRNLGQVMGLGQRENVAAQAALVPGVQLLGYQLPRAAHPQTHHYLREMETHVLRAQAVLRICMAMKDRGLSPDVIVAHAGWGDTLFLREIFPKARLAGYFEYYRRTQGADIGFDPEFPLSIDNRLEVRMKNITHLLAWEDCDVAWSPTRWQASLFPAAQRGNLKVQHEGVDTRRVAPDPGASLTLPDGKVVRAGEEVLTLVNRNMEPYRGFHIFMRALPEILRRRPQALVLIVGSEDDVAYGNRGASGESWKTVMLRELGDRLDASRVVFMGKLPYENYLRVLQVSRAHVYLTYPYILSWSLLEAMACGCTVIGSHTPPVAEFITEGETGLLVDFFDVPGLANRVCEVLAAPHEFCKLREGARRKIVEEYDLEKVCLPALTRLICGE
jgi:glycosyltransferase involved in cell wall biosynthesis